MNAPLSFVFPAYLRDKIIIGHDLPPEFHAPIPMAACNTYRWPGGMYSEQTLVGKGYAFCMLNFDIQESILLEPLALLSFNTIQYTLQGNCRCELTGYGPVPLMQGTYMSLYVPEGRHKAWFTTGRYNFFYILALEEHLSLLSEEHPSLRPLIQHMRQSSKLGLMTDRMRIDMDVLEIINEISTCTKKGIGLELAMQAALLKLMVHYDDHLRRGAVPLKHSVEIQAISIREYITRNLTDPDKVHIAALATLFRMSRSSLERIFKKHFGLSIGDFVHDTRLGMAFELLRSGKKNIQEAAESVGYDYVSSFSREFKKKYGYAPKEVKHGISELDAKP